MTISERRLGLQEGLLKHAAELIKEKKLAHEEKIKHYEANMWLGRGMIVFAIALIISGIMRWW